METPTEMRTKVPAKAAADPDFRARLLQDPKASVHEALGVSLPDAVRIQVHQETAGAVHPVLPPGSSLSESDLQAAAGGIAFEIGSDDPDPWGVSDW